MPAPKAAGRLAYVDGLRAFSVLLVILFHARVHMPGVQLGTFFRECSHGVDLFFVLSGFCLSLPVLERLAGGKGSSFDLAGFALKRCLRIFPPFVVALLLFASVGSAVRAHGIALPPGMADNVDWANVVSQMFFLDRGIPLVNHSFWTLAVEFRWYLLFPLFLAIGATRPRALLLVIGLVILGATATRATSTDLAMLDAFLLGIVAAHMRVSGNPLARYGLVMTVVGGLLGLIIEQQAQPFPIQTNPGWHIAAFGLVIFAGRTVWLQRLLANRVLVAVGIASYSLYLVHEPILSATAIWLSGSAGPLLAETVAVVFALAGGFVLWAIVERPITKRAFVARFVQAGRPSVTRLFARFQIPAQLELQRAPSAVDVVSPATSDDPQPAPSSAPRTWPGVPANAGRAVSP